MQTEKYSEYYLVCNDEKMIMNVRWTRPVKISHKLMSGAWGDECTEHLARHVFYRNRDHAFISFLLRFPQRGIYLFSIFAAPAGKNTILMHVAYQLRKYIVTCKSKE